MKPVLFYVDIFIFIFRVLMAEEAQRVYRYSTVEIIIKIIIIKQPQKLYQMTWFACAFRVPEGLQENEDYKDSLGPQVHR